MTETQISTSTEPITGGQEFSIFVNIQNPFEAPITVKGVSTQLPDEFIDMEQIVFWTLLSLSYIELIKI